MKAACWIKRNTVEVLEVPEPRILNPTDAIVRVTLTAICGSDLHLYDGYIPTMMRGDIIGHEFMGEVIDKGSEVQNINLGDRVVVAFDISCGQCWSCQRQLYSLCENSNPNAWMAEKLWGHSGAGAFGYSHLMGGYAGGQAQYVRVPYADVATVKIPEGVTDEQALFLGGIFPTGYMAAENCDIRAGDTVAVWGCGPVGQFAIASALMLGAGRVIAIDRFPYRLAFGQRQGAEVLNYEESDVLDALKDLTAGRGPDACIDAVGSEAHGTGLEWMVERSMQAMRIETDRPIALRQAIKACRNGGTVSVPGVYGGFIDRFPMGSLMNRSLTVKSGQTHVQRYFQPLLQRIVGGEIDPGFVITHRASLEEAPHYYEMFKHKRDDCMKVVLNPW